jgi:hypothetical protein
MAGFNLKDLRDMIPEYDGDQSTLFDFIEAVNFAIENVPENQQNALIFVIKSKLVGKARKFISSRQLQEWNDIKDLLISHYGDCRDTEGLLRDLNSSFQKSNETPRAFAQRIEDLLTRIRSSVALNNELNQAARNALNLSHEKMALKTFLAGLSDPLGSIIRSQKPNTLEQAEQFLIEEENITYLKNFKISKPSPHNQVNHKIVPKENYQSHSGITTPDNKYCSYCKKPGHLINTCFKRNQKQFNEATASTSNFRPSNNNRFNNASTNNYNQNTHQPNQQRSSVIQYPRNQNSNVNHLNYDRDAELGTPNPHNETPVLTSQEQFIRTTEF